MRTPTLLLTALLATTPAFGHGLWTEQRRGNIEVIYGHGAEDNAFKAEKVSGAWAYDGAGKMVPLTVQRLADHARLQPLRAPAVLAVAVDNGAWSQTPDKQWINAGRSQVPNSIHSLHTYKYSLAIYHEGTRLPALESLRLAIVPQVDPLTVGPGKTLPGTGGWQAGQGRQADRRLPWRTTPGQRRDRCRRPCQRAGAQ
jgi:hypothetical protein